MGIYLNPGNAGFERILRSEYIDKTGLLSIINEQIDTVRGLICVSCPRRFGKSYAANMLCAYYDRTCDSHALFDNLKISNASTYEDYINKYNVIYIDVASFLSELKHQNHSIKDVANDIAQTIRLELIEDKPELSQVTKVSECLKKYVRITGQKFIFIIDEWDVVIREAQNDSATQTA
ncbi:Predicted AAA-ATPase [Ruminococcaceae bacterium FB2012]|nr:Predicted AAA-ATPase [Ruminococcaceae bacterium FB2012]